jgi:hypothetical protein
VRLAQRPPEILDILSYHKYPFVELLDFRDDGGHRLKSERGLFSIP